MEPLLIGLGLTPRFVDASVYYRKANLCLDHQEISLHDLARALSILACEKPDTK